jgi:hypothetical protein
VKIGHKILQNVPQVIRNIFKEFKKYISCQEIDAAHFAIFIK